MLRKLVSVTAPFERDRNATMLLRSTSLCSLQVRSDYMQYHASKVSDGMALQLGCLEIRWDSRPCMSATI